MILSQHYCLTHLEQVHEDQIQIAHLNLPTEHFFVPPPDPRRVTTSLKMLDTLSKLMNGEAWLQYCEWLCPQVETILESFKPEALDEYQLEAHLKDFTHEVHSVLVQNLRKQSKALVLRWGELADLEKRNPLDQQTLKIEKELIKCRMEIKEALIIRYQVLDEIRSGIIKIEEMHPELLLLKQSVLLLHGLLQSELQLAKPLGWGQRILMEQLLNDQLGVLTAVNCDTGLERTSFAFSIRLALQALQSHYPFEELVQMAMHWEDVVKATNLLLAHKGFDRFQEWILEPSLNREEEILRHQLILIGRLREWVLAALRRLSIPLTVISLGPGKSNSRKI